MRQLRLLLLGILVSFVGCGTSTVEKPRLLVTVVVDGLSTQQLVRHRDCLTAGGFERLLSQGAWLRNASYLHATTFTGAGHGTIASGASPCDHGLVANSWWDRKEQRSVYCVEDAETQTVGGASARPGVSPRNLLIPTLADVLYLRSQGKSQSLAISIKDRGAATGSGRHGKAYWFDNGSGRFQSSSFYEAELPDWWTECYATWPQNRYLGQPRAMPACAEPWHAEHAAILDTLRRLEVKIQDRTTLPDRASDGYYRALKSSPHGDTLTLEFARVALDNMGLGRGDDRIDQLFLSFSAHDYVAHDTGPDSPLETSVLQNLDRLLDELFARLDATVGRGRWALAFTADHGYPETPEIEKRRGHDAGRLDPRRLGVGLDARLDSRFGEHDWVQKWRVPTYYLDVPAGVDSLEVAREGQQWLEAQVGVHRVYRRDELLGPASGDSLLALAKASFQPDRSGDLFVLQEPNWYLLYDPRADVCTHGSPWPYDRRVPLIFLGPGVRPGSYDTEAHIRDLAPTLLALAGEPAASFMTGRVLHSILR